MSNETIFLADDVFKAVLKLSVPVKVKLILKLFEDQDVLSTIEGYFEENEVVKKGLEGI